MRCRLWRCGIMNVKNGDFRPKLLDTSEDMGPENLELALQKCCYELWKIQRGLDFLQLQLCSSSNEQQSKLFSTRFVLLPLLSVITSQTGKSNLSMDSYFTQFPQTMRKN